jgi:hypothetical protein
MKNNIVHYRIIEDVHYDEHSEKEKIGNPYSVQVEKKGLFGKKWEYLKYKHVDYAFEGWYLEKLTFKTIDEAHDYIKKMVKESKTDSWRKSVSGEFIYDPDNDQVKPLQNKGEK